MVLHEVKPGRTITKQCEPYSIDAEIPFNDIKPEEYAAIFFSGFFLALYRLSPLVRWFSWLLPTTYGTILLQDVMLRGRPPQLLLMLALFGFAAVLLLVAWFRLGRQMARE